MAVVDYRLVYRDGAELNAPVVSMKLADTYAELPQIGNTDGDLGFDKTAGKLYYWSGGWWELIVNYPGGFYVDEFGRIHERGRTIPLGEWQDIPFNSNNFVGVGAVWTVTIQYANRYNLIGNMLTQQFWLDGTLNNAAGTSLLMNLPLGFISAGYASGVGRIQSKPVLYYISTGQPYFTIINMDNTPFAAGNCQVIGNISIPI